MIMTTLNSKFVKLVILLGIILFALACPRLLFAADLPVVAHDVNDPWDNLVDLSKFKVNAAGTTGTLSFNRTLIYNLTTSPSLDTLYLRLDQSTALTGLTANTILQANATKKIVSVVNRNTSDVLTLAAGPTFVWRAPTTGTVTSVGLALPTAIFDISGSPITTAGTLTATFDTQLANLVFAGPTTGAAAAPTMRALVNADLPIVDMPHGGANKALTANNGGIVWSDADSFEILAGTATARQRLWSGATATPAWSPYADVATVSQGDMIYALTSSALATLAKDTNATRYMSNQGTSNAPSWNQVNLANGVTGSLPNANLANSAITIAGVSTALGGSITETTMLDSIGSTRGMIPLRGASTWAGLAVGSANTVLNSNGIDASWGTVPNAALANSSISFTDGAGIGGSGSPTSLGGTYTVSATSATPRFAGMGLGEAATSNVILGVSRTNVGSVVGTTPLMWLSDLTGATNNAYQLGFGYRDGTTTTPQAIISGIVSNSTNQTAVALGFFTRTATTNVAPSERMRILTSGAVIIGATAATSPIDGAGDLQVEDELLAKGDVSLDGGNFVWNDAGAAKTARWESDTNANMLVVDGINDRVGIGTATPAQTLDVLKAGTQLQLSYDASNYARFATSSAGVLTISSSAATGIKLESTTYPGTVNANRILFASGSNIVGTSLIFNFDSVTSTFTVGGPSNSTYNISSVAAAIAAGTGAGTGPTLSITGNAHAGKITLITGAVPTGGGAVIATITPGITAPTGFYPVIAPGTINTALLTSATNNPYVIGASTTTWTMNAGTTGLAGGSTYIWDYYAGVN